MSGEILQHRKASDLQERLNRLRERAEHLHGTLAPADLHRSPPGGGWSVAQVFEHLCLADDSYLDAMIHVLSRAGSGTGAAATPWRPSLMGNLMVRSFRSPRKMVVGAPRIYRPGPSPRPEVIRAYLERNRRTLQLLERAAGVHWQKLRLVSPVTRLVRLNLGDGFEIIVTHAERHFRQIERILEAL